MTGLIKYISQMFAFGADGLSEDNENQKESLCANGDQNMDKIIKELHKTDGVVKNGYDIIDVLSVVDTESSNLLKIRLKIVS
jgi:hypothetical protein